MNNGDALALLRRMVEIPSPSGSEQTLTTYLAAELDRFGFDSFIDAAGNVVGGRGSAGGPLIMLLGHVDTVSDILPVHQEGSRLYGRGTVDAKGALATMIAAVAQSQIADARLVVVGAVEEETPGSRGAHYLLDHYIPDAVIIGEPSGWSNVVLGYKGRVGIHYEVRRPASHMASPNEKATEVAIAFWNQLTRYMEGLGGDGGLFHRSIATLGEFSGDIERARLDISCRTPPGFDFAGFDEFLNTIGGDAQLSVDERTPAILMDRSSPTARAFIRSIRAHGGTPKCKVKTGTSDMNIVSKRWHVPMAAYGPGDSSLDHTAEEHIDLDEYLTAITVLRDALPLLIDQLKHT